MKRASPAYTVALSAISCAVATAALTMGAYVDVLLAAGYLIAVFALMVPVSRGMWWGNFLALTGAVILASLFCGSPLKLLPFAAFLGLHPLLNGLQKTYCKKKVFFLLAEGAKAAWFDLSLLVAWFLLGPLFGIADATWYPYVAPYLYLIVFTAGTLAFLAYDVAIFLCQRSVNRIMARIGR